MKNFTKKINQLLLIAMFVVGAGALTSQFNRANAVTFTNCPSQQGSIGTYYCTGTVTTTVDHYECQLGTTTDNQDGCCQYVWANWYCTKNGVTTYIGTKGLLKYGAVGDLCNYVGTPEFPDNEMCSGYAPTQ